MLELRVDLSVVGPPSLGIGVELRGRERERERVCVRVRVLAVASPEDLYGQIVGERGNVPEGLKWEIPGLTLEERKLVYARNLEAATGGETAYGLRLRVEDLDLARKQLEQELTQAAKVHTEEEVASLTVKNGREYVILQYDVLTEMHFKSFILPTSLIGQSVQSIPVEGTLEYKVLAYSKDLLLDLLLPGLEKHIEAGHRLVPGSVMRDGISVHVIEYDDDLQWVKITAELTGKQHTMLSPSTPFGRAFGQKLREAIRGMSIDNAERVIQNFPEVERAHISVWPPWRNVMPSLTSNISLVPEQ